VEPEEGNTASVFLGNGDGTFQAPEIFSGGDFLAYALGDFNGDGIPDLAMVNSIYTTFVSNTVYILLGNGDGTFSVGSQIDLPSVLLNNQLVTADFNGDGKLDIAMAFGSTIYVFLGNGDGTFQAPVISNVGTFNLEGGIGDFNGDGRLDLIAIAGTQLAWLQGNGDGTFQTPSTYYAIGPDTNTILAADLNRDGKLDLITVQGAPTNTYTVMLGSGGGAFQAGVASPVGSALTGGVIADINADGMLDLVLSDAASVGTSTSTFLLLGNGDATFQSPLVLPSGSMYSVAGDFNNDGKMDMVLAQSTGALVYLLQETPVPGFSQPSVAFGQQVVGTTIGPVYVTLTNSGTVPLTISSITIAGANTSNFAQTNNCPGSLAAGANCQIGVTFTPTALSTFSASLIISDDTDGSPQQSVSLSGQGINPAPEPYLSPANVTFPHQYVGTSGLPQSIVLVNVTDGVLNIASVTATPADFAPLSTCGSTLAPGASCSIGVFFDPSASGTRTGTLTVQDSASNSPQTASLTGTGQDFSLAPSSQATATVSPGQTASYTLTVAPGGGFDQTVTFSCSGAPAQSTCSVAPGSITLSGSSASTASVTVSTAGSSMGMMQPINGPPADRMLGLWFALSGSLGLAVLLTGSARWRPVLRPQMLYGLAYLCLLSAGVTMSACGGGNGGSGSGGTPAGTYNLTVTGSFASGPTNLAHTTKLTLVVQ
jgi:hypothetical protein